MPIDYLKNITQFLREFPVQSWTPEYIIFILENILTGIKNYCVEESLVRIDVKLYNDILKHRAILGEVYGTMCTIQQYHAHILWAQFREVFGVTPQSYFVKSFNKLRNHKAQYEAAIQQGYISHAQNQVEKMNLSSRDNSPVNP